MKKDVHEEDLVINNDSAKERFRVYFREKPLRFIFIGLILNILLNGNPKFSDGVNRPLISAIYFDGANILGIIFEVTMMTIGFLLIPMVILTPILYLIGIKGERKISTCIASVLLFVSILQVFRYF